MTWKVGDKFTLPGNSLYKGVYTITRLDTTYSEDTIVYWAYFPEDGNELFSEPQDMERVTKLHEILA